MKGLLGLELAKMCHCGEHCIMRVYSNESDLSRLQNHRVLLTLVPWEGLLSTLTVLEAEKGLSNREREMEPHP